MITLFKNMRYIPFLLVFFLTPLILQGTPVASKTILVVGGAGYIGSHVNEMLYRRGYQTIVLDNLSMSRRDAVTHGIFVQGDLSDNLLLDRIFSQHKIDAVMHFAALKDIGESVKEPLLYYINNVSGSLHLLSAMLRHHVNFIIFSSSAAVFGLPDYIPIDEEHPCRPINPYGTTKLTVENILHDFDRAYGIKYCSLRYFNAAGGDPEGKIKYACKKDANLIPIILRSLQDKEKVVTIYGSDYPTPDGTCVRDYVHVEDIGSAHIAALEKLFCGAPSGCYNLGNGEGFSIKQVISAVEKVTGQTVKVREGARRPGDPPILVASSKKAQRELDWQPAYSSLEMMIEHAWNAMQDTSEQ